MTFAQPRTIASMLVEPPVAPAVEVDSGVPVLEMPTMDLPGAPTGAAAAGLFQSIVSKQMSLVCQIHQRKHCD